MATRNYATIQPSAQQLADQQAAQLRNQQVRAAAASSTPAQTTTPKPVAAPPKTTIGVQDEALVEKRLPGILDSQSPFMQQARNEGVKLANRRGLINSSIAAGASEAEAIRAALPIAQQDAQTFTQFGLQKAEAGTKTAIAAQEAATQAALQATQLNAQREAQIKDLESRENLSRAEAEMRMSELEKNIGAQKEIEAGRIGAQQASQTQAEAAQRASQTQGEVANAANLQKQIDAQIAQQSSQIAGADRAQASTNFQNLTNGFRDNMLQIQQNKELNEATKEALITDQFNSLQAGIQIQNAMYGTTFSVTREQMGLAPAKTPGQIAASKAPVNTPNLSQVPTTYIGDEITVGGITYKWGNMGRGNQGYRKVT